MRIVVVYKSKSGYAKTYAEMIGKALEADVLEHDPNLIPTLLSYDIIIYGGGLYVAGINGLKLITENLDALKDKRIAVYACGATPGRPSEIEEILAANFTTAQRQQIPFFYLRGGFDFSKLTFVDKILMTLLKMKLRMKRNKSGDEKGMLEAYSKPLDFTSEHRIKELVDQVRQWT